MRVLLFTSIFEYKGNETYYTEEINSLIKNFPNVEVLVYSVARERNRITRYKKNILWIERRSLKNILVLILFLKDMVKAFTKFKPDVIHSVYVIESIIMGVLGKILRVPSILHGRGMDVNYDPFISLKSNILIRIAGKINNMTLTVSKAMKQDCLRLNFPRKKVITIYDGINFSIFKPIKKKNYSTNSKFEIYNIGQYVPIKCHELIIETCKDLRDNNINIHLTLTGFGPLEKQIKNLIKKYNLENWINLTGFINRDKVIHYFEKADLYIQTSLTEGMPISVLEAMSMELPVVLTNAGGMPELVQNNGGILIKKNNKVQLYNAILNYLNNPQKIEIGGKINREFIINNFDWNKHAKKLYNVYLKLTKKKEYRCE